MTKGMAENPATPSISSYAKYRSVSKEFAGNSRTTKYSAIATQMKPTQA